jgi:hypothetical protein
MEPLGDPETLAGSVHGDTKIELLAEQLMDSELDVAVAQSDGKPIGRLSRRTVMAVLVGGHANG